MNQRYFKIFSLLLVLLIFSGIKLFAQPTPPSAPIDGGLSLLIAGGVGYGIKKMYKKKK